MRKLKNLVTGLVMLLTTAALQAGTATIEWDYDFASNPDVASFKIYGAAGTNTVFTANNGNATRVVTVNRTGTGTVVDITGDVTNISGAWTFVVVAVSNTGVNSPNSQSVWGNVKPGAPINLRIQ